MEEKHKSTTTTSSLRVTLSTTYQSRIVAYPRYNDQSGIVAFPRYSDQSVDRNSQIVADINNNWNYGKSALVDKQFNGHFGNPEKNIANDNVNPENNIANDNVNPENNIVIENVNPEDNGVAGNADNKVNNNVNREIHNDGNMSRPDSNLGHLSYQNANSRHRDEPTGWNKQNGALQASDAEKWSNHLKALDTVELINIKQSLESLKYILGKLRPNSKQTVLEQLMSAEALSGQQPAGQPGMNVFGDNNVEASQPGRFHVQTRTAVSPLAHYFLDTLKTGLNPPQMAAPAAPSQLDVRLLTKLLNESNADHLNTIIKENADAVRNFLPQILLYLQQRQQGSEYQQRQQGSEYQQRQQGSEYQQRQQGSEYQQRQQGSEYQQRQQGSEYQQRQQGSEYQQQQQQKSGFITPGQSVSSPRETHVRSPDVPALDYNRNTIKEMIRNIAMYNKVDTFVDSEKCVENFLRNLQTGNLRKFDISSLGDRRARTLDDHHLDTPGSVVLPHN